MFKNGYIQFSWKNNIYPNLNSVSLNAVRLNAASLNDQQCVGLNKINKIKDYFVAEIKRRELMTKSLRKYITSFEYFDKSLIALSLTTGSISITWFATVIGESVGIASASVSLAKKIVTCKNNVKNNTN